MYYLYTNRETVKNGGIMETVMVQRKVEKELWENLKKKAIEKGQRLEAAIKEAFEHYINN